MHHSKKSGFTILELLVIIFVIALLAAVLFPMVTRYIEDGKRTEIMADTKMVFISTQAALLHTLDTTELTVTTPRTLADHIEVAPDEIDLFFEEIGRYLPSGFSTEFAFTVQGGVVIEVTTRTREMICVFDNETQLYTITDHDENELGIFNSGQEFDPQGIKEGDLP